MKYSLPYPCGSLSGNKDKVEWLLDRGANINMNFNGFTPLLIASENGHKEVVKLLLDRGANISDRSGSIGVGYEALYSTPLTLASEHGRIEVVELLLDRGAHINDKDRNGWTSLNCASHQGHKNIVELLLCRGSDISDQHNYGGTKQKDVWGYKSITIESLKGRKEVVSVFEKWPLTMLIVVLQELQVYHLTDCESCIELLEFFGRIK